jgi:hypothetical protein
LRSLRRKPETRTSARAEGEAPDSEFEPRYVEVPRRRRAQLAAERNLKWGLAVLLLSLGLIGAAIIVSGPRALVPIVICLVTLTILWALARLRVFHQRNGVFFATALVCLLGATVPMIERGYVELDRMAHAPAKEVTVAAAAPVEQQPAPQKAPEPPPVAALDPDMDVPSLVEAMNVPEPTDPDVNLVRIVERTKVMVGRKPYVLNAGDTFPLEGTKDGQVTFRANELRLSVSDRVVELMAPAPPEPVVANDSRSEMPSPVAPPAPLESRVSDRDLDGATTARAQTEAVRRYPAIGVEGSVENALFVEEFKRLKEERPEFFDAEEWPLYLAEALAKEHGWPREQ